MKNQDEWVIYAKANKQHFINQVIAGKTEVAETLACLDEELCLIDADHFRSQFPGYNGKNSYLFQRGASKLVDLVFTYLLKKEYSFILDGTFALGRAEENISRTLKRGYEVTLYYVYQDPLIAWRFTKEREIAEGRHVPKETFINSYFKAQENVALIKNLYPNEIEMHVVMKDYRNEITEIHFDTDNLNIFFPTHYTREELEVLLND